MVRSCVGACATNWKSTIDIRFASMCHVQKEKLRNSNNQSIVLKFDSFMKWKHTRFHVTDWVHGWMCMNFCCAILINNRNEPAVFDECVIYCLLFFSAFFWKLKRYFVFLEYVRTTSLPFLTLHNAHHHRWLYQYIRHGIVFKRSNCADEM